METSKKDDLNKPELSYMCFEFIDRLDRLAKDNLSFSITGTIDKKDFYSYSSRVQAFDAYVAVTKLCDCIYEPSLVQARDIWSSRLNGAIHALYMARGIPYMLTECARAMEFGARHYGRNNWKLGMRWDRLLNACLRHLMKYAFISEFDECKASHIGCAAFCLQTLSYYFTKDDEYREIFFRSIFRMADV